jgi:chemotaxis protein MotB
MEDKKQPIIVKKVNKGGHGHHGGAWKVAMADFAIAMMAFFMVMWLLGGTTVEQKAAISAYFKNPSLTEGKSHVAAKGQDGPGGASTSMIQLGGTMELPKGEGQKTLEKSRSGSNDNNHSFRPRRSAPAEEQKAAFRREQTLYQSISHRIQKVLEKKALKKLKDQVFLDISDEGMRIQIVDKENRAMFASGSSHLRGYAEKLLIEIAGVIKHVPSKVSISGHTDASPFTGRIDYSNWELSADRANAARRTMIHAGLPEKKVARVVGLGSTVLFIKKKPKSPLNRRISIIILNSKALAQLERYKSSQNRNKPHWAGKRTEDPLATPGHRLSMPNNKSNKQSRSHDIAKNGKPENTKSVNKGKISLPKLNLPPIIDPNLLPKR